MTRFDHLDFADVAFAVFVGFVVVFILGLGYDGIQSYMAFDAKAECRAHRMEPLRKPLTTHVVCAPSVIRQDTSTININGLRQ